MRDLVLPYFLSSNIWLVCSRFQWEEKTCNSIIFIRFGLWMGRGEGRRRDMCRLVVNFLFLFLSLSSSGQRRRRLAGLFYPLHFSNKEAQWELKAPKWIVFLAGLLKLGGEVYINKLFSTSFGNLDLESEWDGPTAFGPLHHHRSRRLCSARPHKMEEN